MNKRSQGTWTFILFALVFYGILSVILFSMGKSNTSNISTLYNPPLMPENPTLLNYILIPFQYIGFFFGMVNYTISGLPFWFNIIIFFPVGITILWIIISLIRGYGG